MRTLLLASALLVLAACSDTQQPTAPRSASSRGSGAGDVAPAGQGIAQPYSKPTDQVGFTKVSRVESAMIVVQAGAMMTGHSYCPANTTLVSGGYNVANISATLPFVAESLGSTVENVWEVRVYNPGASAISLWVEAYCVS